MAIEIDLDCDDEVESKPTLPKGSKGKESIRKQIDSERGNNEYKIKRKASSELAR
jgi:hypothetical protein